MIPNMHTHIQNEVPENWTTWWIINMMNQTKPEPNASTIASLIVYAQQSLQLARDANSRITASCKPSLFLYSLYHEVSGRAIKQKQKQFQYHKNNEHIIPKCFWLDNVSDTLWTRDCNYPNLSNLQEVNTERRWFRTCETQWNASYSRYKYTAKKLQVRWKMKKPLISSDKG